MGNESKKILRNFIEHLDTFYKDLGVFNSIEDKQGIAREIYNRFYSNLISLENHLILKDSLSSALIQRYNHELVVDFYYLLDPSDEEDKIKKFFNHSYNSVSRQWSALTSDKKRAFVPSRVADDKVLVSIYKTLSNMAHPNIMSIRLNRKGEEFEFRIIKGAIALCIIEISACINHKIFRDLFPNINWVSILESNRVLQTRAGTFLSQEET